MANSGLMSSGAHYPYPLQGPLGLGSGEIRILTLHPGSFNDPISCTGSCHYLHETPAYEALSYTWGSHCGKCKIKVNGADFEVTANLETALRYLRYPPSRQDGRKDGTGSSGDTWEGDRRLWIDAICINQDDLRERGDQVQHMLQIFSQAWRVLAWLGEADEESNSAMDLIVEINRGGGLFLSDQHDPTLILAALTPQQTWAALAKLWARPYWGRVWIIQELAASLIRTGGIWMPDYRAEVGCGYRWVKLGVFQNAWDYLEKYLDHPWVRAQGEYVAARNLFKILFGHAHRQHTLGDLLALTYATNATDPRDHFFAILGLASDHDRSCLTPDYTKSLEEVSGRFLEHVIRTERKLDILMLGDYTLGDQTPSWAPNFSDPSRDEERFHWKSYWDNFSASPECAGAGMLAVKFSSIERVICLPGYLVDTIASVNGPLVSTDMTRVGEMDACFSLCANFIQAYPWRPELPHGVHSVYFMGQSPKASRLWQLQWERQWLRDWYAAWWLFWTAPMRDFVRHTVPSRHQVFTPLQGWETRKQMLWDQWEVRWRNHWGYEIKAQWRRQREMAWSWREYSCRLFPSKSLEAKTWHAKLVAIDERFEVREGPLWIMRNFPWDTIEPRWATGRFSERTADSALYSECALNVLTRTLSLDHHRQGRWSKRGGLLPILGDRPTSTGGGASRESSAEESGDTPWKPLNPWEPAKFASSTQALIRHLANPKVGKPPFEGKCFFTTRTGYIGMGPPGMSCDDKLVVLLGGRMPFVLRKHAAAEDPQAAGGKPMADLYKIVGEAYCDTIMDGELDTSKLELEQFHIV
ncbi:hypothetical protein NKR23_g10094 [Pleurostoma richardsiae]|uniref:Heterokaryon incompatibility domain-containing protein n=1 Tax=Pleurostoma richardsiae TaxID=41990 RepID=A0AA38RAZ6_9PEZI|nr:hypothetical protein NKR23_g10094 [Pleurostoma richardsiae]